MALYNSATDILVECARIQGANVPREDVTNVVENFYHQLLNLEEVDESYLKFDEECVAVREYANKKFIIEFEDLSKYMRDTKTTAKDSIHKICEHYDINEADTHIVIESLDNIMNQLAEAKYCMESGNSIAKSYGKDKMELTYAQFNEMVQAGVKLMVKPSMNDTLKIY